LPRGWSASDPVEENSMASATPRKIDGHASREIGGRKRSITACAKRGEEKFTTSIEPLPSMPTLLWEEPAQCAVHA
jgi:hypothetical protein